VPARVLANIRRGLIYKPYARRVGRQAPASL
jgi:hypothetical protein